MGSLHETSSKPTLVYFAAWLLMGSAVGCGNPQDNADASMDMPFSCEVQGAPPDGGKLPAEVFDVLERRCHGCHGDPTDRFAPMSLVTWADFQGCHVEGQTVPNYERMRIRINDEHTPMPPIREPQLTDEERDILNRWVAMGAPPAG